MNQNSKITIYVGISGGVDSAVSAAVLKQQGFNVVGVFMKNYSGEDFGINAYCPWEEDQKMAQLVCEHLNIPFKSYNFEKEYRAKVLDYFFSEYKLGRTPNPDVMCNREVKFDLFLQKAMQEGADFIATGHYVQKVSTTLLKDLDPKTYSAVQSFNNLGVEADTQYALFQGADVNKDQSYFLNAITPGQLAKSVFPIGHLSKPEVRQIASDLQLPNFNRPDSQGICFIGEIDVQKFLRENITTKPGNIIDVDTNKIVGSHDGVYYYTIGQREGLKIGGQAIPYFVVGKDIVTNNLLVGHGTNHPKLLSTNVIVEDWRWLVNINTPEVKEWISKNGTQASVRYRREPQAGKLDVNNLSFIFNEPERAVTPGQSLVIYSGNMCLGGGVIV